MILIALAVGLAELMLIARPLMPLMPLKVTPAPKAPAVLFWETPSM